MVGLEHLLAQGVSAGEPLHIEDHYPALKNKRERDIKFVAGNAMHLNVLGRLMQYVICQADWKQGQRGPCDYLLGACFEAMRGTNHWYIKSQNSLLALPSFYLMSRVLSPPSVYDQLS